MLKGDCLSVARRMVARQLEGGEETEEDDPDAVNEEANGNGDEGSDSNEEDDWAPVEGPTVLNHVTLAHSKGV
jgi:hypothetical protein